MAEPGSSSSPRGKSKPRRLVVVTGAVLAIGLGVAYGLHFLSNPWALPLPGRPGLVGYWQGEMTLPSRDRRRVFLELKGVLPSSTSCDNCPDMDGTAKVCGKPNMDYEVYGHPLNYRGTRFSLSPRTTAGGAGTYLGQLEGTWDRTDLLKIQTILIHKDANGVAHATTDTDQPAEPTAQISMRRTSEAIFDTGC